MYTESETYWYVCYQTESISDNDTGECVKTVNMGNAIYRFQGSTGFEPYAAIQSIQHQLPLEATVFLLNIHELSKHAYLQYLNKQCLTNYNCHFDPAIRTVHKVI